jgi:hypothetical protein
VTAVRPSLGERARGLLEQAGRSDRRSLRVIARLAGLVVGDQAAAEGFIQIPDEAPPTWVIDHADDTAWLELALRVATESRAGSHSAVASLQQKAATLQNVLLILVPAALGVFGASVAQLQGVGGAILFTLLVVAVLGLFSALVVAVMASGLVLSLEPNLALLVTDAQPLSAEIPDEQLRELRLREIRGMHNSALLVAMRTSFRLGQDIAFARRCAFFSASVLGLALYFAWLG